MASYPRQRDRHRAGPPRPGAVPARRRPGRRPAPRPDPWNTGTALVRPGQPDRPGARRRGDVRRRDPGDPAPDTAPGRDDGRRRAQRLPRRHVGPARADQPVHRGHHVRYCRRRPARGRRRTRDPRTRHGHHAGRHAVRRLRPAPAAVGARGGGRQLPDRAPGLRQAPARPGRAGRVRRPDRRGRPSARRAGPTDHRGRARRDPGRVPSRAPGNRSRPRCGLLPALAAASPGRPAPGVRRADGGGHRPDAAVDQAPAAAAVAPGLGPHRRQGARHPRHRDDPLGDGTWAGRGAGAARVGVRRGGRPGRTTSGTAGRSTARTPYGTS